MIHINIYIFSIFLHNSNHAEHTILHSFIYSHHIMNIFQYYGKPNLFFICCITSCCVNVTQFISQSNVVGYLGCFLLFIIMNNTVMHIFVHKLFSYFGSVLLEIIL